MEKMGAVMRTERKGSRALCSVGKERVSGLYGPETEMPRWPALSSPLLSHPLPAAENASLWVPARSFPDSRAHYPHLVLGAFELPKTETMSVFLPPVSSLLDRVLAQRSFW